MNALTPPVARLFVIMARDERVAVVFRRGPSAWTLLLKWKLKSDELIAGQWLKGRIYERRCDLSPSGDRLVYFVGKFGHPWGSWIAISRPPDFTAQTLWRNGTTWGGGGIFESETSLLIHQGETEPSEGFSLDSTLTISRFIGNPGMDEIRLIHHAHLVKSGWTLVGEGKKGALRTYEKASKSRCLRMLIRPNDRKPSVYDVLTLTGEPLFGLTNADWADWDQNGDLLFARDGRLYRLAAAKLRGYPSGGDTVLKCIADLNGLKPNPQPSTTTRRGRFR